MPTVPYLPACYHRRWAPSFCADCINRSVERPLLSGFYRILTTSLELCGGAGMLDAEAAVDQAPVAAGAGEDDEMEEGASDAMDTDEPDNAVAEAGAASSRAAAALCRHMYQDYLCQVLVACRRYTVSALFRKATTIKSLPVK